MPSYPDLYVLRHGETEWNRQGRFQGGKDSALTEKGQAQALRQGELLSSVADLPQQRFCSPQGRAQRTACLALGADKPFIVDTRLKEIGFGDWEGLRRVDIEADTGYSFAGTAWNFESVGGESFTQISDRVALFLDELQGPAVIVTHGTTAMVIRGLWLRMGQQDIEKLSREQGCIFCLSNGVETVLR